MPQVSTNSPKNAVTPIFQTALEGSIYVVAPDDTYASIQADTADHARPPVVPLPIGATVRLPGPNTDPLKLPSNGDYYRVSDPLGRLGVTSAGHNGELTVDGGGYPMVSNNPTVILGIAYTEAEFTFDDTAQAWICCICLGPDE